MSDESRRSDVWARPGQLLKKHGEAVAARAAGFCAVFGASAWGRFLGLVHDWGKYAPMWQRYLDDHEGRVTHAPEAVCACFLHLPKAMTVKYAGYCIYGHHTGLPDPERLESRDIQPAPAPSEAVREASGLVEDMQKELGSVIRRGGDGYEAILLFLHMCFSALVDADRLDAESAEDSEHAAWRGLAVDWSMLEVRFDTHMADLSARAADTPINRARAEILDACRAVAGETKGFYSLNVPTGGGKTLAAMAFALEHRRKHKLRRIVCAIPYTSIIEQNAKVYKEIFGEDAVLEHHSNFEPRAGSRAILAMENWDAPLVVTTNVQLFETLLGSGPAQARKLHNLADSIIILDEAQMLPTANLHSILAALRTLAANFGCTVVIGSATLPPHGKIGMMLESCPALPKPVPIIAEPERLARTLCRVVIEPIGKLEWAELARRLAMQRRALCIVNTRKSCRALFERLTVPYKVHLSAAMCPAERSRVLDDVRQRLSRGEPLIVVATNLVEAGVDLDFPVVYRELAGLDSVAQAAGRCNREGRLETGRMYLFETPERSPASQAAALDATRTLLQNGGSFELTADLYLRYFAEYFRLIGDFDRAGFEPLLRKGVKTGELYFRSFDHAFRMIDDGWQMPVVVAYGDGASLIGELRSRGPSRTLLRRCQRYSVNLEKSRAEMLRRQSCLEEVHGILCQAAPGLYREGLGLSGGDATSEETYF